MSQSNGAREEKTVGKTAIIIHLGLMVLGIAALLTGVLADDYGEVKHTWELSKVEADEKPAKGSHDDDKDEDESAGNAGKVENTGYIIHNYIGIAVAFFVFLRFILGIVGPSDLRFSQWVPYTRQRLAAVIEDIRGFMRFRFPERPTHEGIAGVVQTFGLVAFFCMAVSGILLFLYLEPGSKARGTVHAIKEFHEAGMVFIMVFLSMHMGAVMVHALRGHHLWRKMVFISDKISQDKQDKKE